MAFLHSARRTPHAEPSFLMCRPTHYTIAYEINPWMDVTRHVARMKALRQWQQLYDLLTHRLKLQVELIRPIRGLPDLVFTANAGFLDGRTFIRSNFRYPERQGEEATFERYFTAKGMRTVTLPRRYTFEGEGDALWMGRTLIFGFRFRSDAPTHARLARLLKARVLPVELVDARFYHLDTCFCPLDEMTALWFPNAFDRYGRKALEALIPTLISVSEADAVRFACNAIVVNRQLIVHAACSARLEQRLARRSVQLLRVDLSEFVKAGGAAKCLVLRLPNSR